MTSGDFTFNSGHLKLKGRFLATSFCTMVYLQNDGTEYMGNLEIETGDVEVLP
jgi:hypothetical protein